MRRMASLFLGLVLVFGLSSVGRGQDDQSASLGTTKKMSVEVKSIDKKNRTLHVQTPLGEKIVVQVDKHAKNFSQLKVGDRILVQYRQALALAISKANEASDKVKIKTVISTAKPGENPAGKVKTKTKAVVVLDAIDQANQTITFKGPDGESRTVKLEDPETQQFLKQLKVGDAIHITYIEAVAYELMAPEQ